VLLKWTWIYVQEANKRRKEYNQLALELKQMVDSLTIYVRNSNSVKMSSCVGNLIQCVEACWRRRVAYHLRSAVQEEISQLNTKQKRNGLSRYVDAVNDKDDILECYRRIGIHFRQLHVSRQRLLGRYED
jgi:hypothetical protein